MSVEWQNCNNFNSICLLEKKTTCKSEGINLINLTVLKSVSIKKW